MKFFTVMALLMVGALAAPVDHKAVTKTGKNKDGSVVVVTTYTKTVQNAKSKPILNTKPNGKREAEPVVEGEVEMEME